MTDSRPNILFLFADQWIHDWFGFRGHPWARTPNLDRLAAGAGVFTHAFCATPLCSPSRATTLTARWPHQCGVLDNMRSLGRSRQPPLADGQRTWLEAARSAGYRVGYFGKWHLGTDGPVRRGAVGPPGVFEPRTDLPTDDPHADEQGRLLKPVIGEDAGTGQRPPFYARSARTPEETQSGLTATHAIGFLAGASHDTPWLLTTSFHGPHFPHEVPSPFHEWFLPDQVALPANFTDHFDGKPWPQATPWWNCQATAHFSAADWRKTIAGYLGMLALVDSQIGRVMEAARVASGARPLHVIFAADHGEMLGAHQRFDKGPYFYDEVWRVPLILRSPEDGPWPPDGQSPSRRELPRFHRTPVNLLDLGATLFALVNARPPATGRDLREAMQPAPDPAKWPRVAHGSYNYYNGHAFAIRAIRTDEWKYVFNPQTVDELYDLVNDPGELRNRIGDPSTRPVAQELQQRLFRWMREQRDPLAGLDPARLPAAGAFLDLGPGLVPGEAAPV